MKVVTTTSDDIDPILYQKAVSFVQSIVSENPQSPAIINMGLDTSAGMLWNITNKTRWTAKKGEISFLLSQSDEIVGVSCVEKSTNPLLSIGGIRTWVLKPYRPKNVITNFLLESNLEYTREHNMAGMVLTFNDYNRWIYDGIKRKTSGRAVSVGAIWSDWWNDCIVIAKPVKIRNINQWCVIKPTGLHEQTLPDLVGGIDAISE